MKREEIIKSLKLLGILNPTEQDILAYIQNLGITPEGVPQELIGATPISDLQPQLSAINTDIQAPKLPSDVLNQMKAAPYDLPMDMTGEIPMSNINGKMIGNMLKQYLPSQSQILGGVNLAGQTLQRASIQGAAGTNAGVLGGGLQGAASGFQMAGLGGGIIGGLFGGTMGYTATKEQQAARDLLRQQEENAKFLANGVSPTIAADGGIINKQRIRNSNIGFNSDAAKELWKTQLGEPVVEVKADNGNMYKLVRRNDGIYDYYNKNDDTTNLIRRGATAYEGIKDPNTKAVVGFFTGADNYRDYQNTYNNFSQNPNVDNGLELAYDALMAAPLIGGIGAKAAKYIPIMQRLGLSKIIKEGVENTIDNAYDEARPYVDKYKNLPVQMADGGEIMDSVGNVGIQTELGERMVLPNGDIVEVKADKLHKDMDKKDITDFVPEGTVVFSAKETKKNLINPKDYENQVMGYSVVNYDENDPQSSSLKEIKFGDILGDKPLSPSQALEQIRKKYKTVSDDRQDIFSEATNKENKKARMPYISALVLEQAKNNGNLSPQQFGYGGGVTVRKYPDGGGIYPNSQMAILNGNYNLPSMRYPQFNPLQQRELSVYDQSGGVIDTQNAMLPSNMFGAYYGLQLNTDNTYDAALNQWQLSGYLNNPNSYFNTAPIIGGSGTLPTERFVNYMPSTGTSITLDPNNPYSGKEWLMANAGVSDPYANYTQIPEDVAASDFGLPYANYAQIPEDVAASDFGQPYANSTQIPKDAPIGSMQRQPITPLSPLPTGILPSQVLSSGIVTQAPVPPRATTGIDGSPYATRQAEIAAARADADVARVYEGLYPRLDKLDALNQQSYAQDVALGNKNIGLKTGVAGATALNELVTTGMQNPMVYGKYQTPYYINEQYRGMTPSQLDNQVSQIRSQANNTVAQLIGQGLTPSQAAVAAAPIIDASNQKEGELRSRFYEQQNTLDRAKYTALNTMRNANDAESARVQQQTLTNQNAITARLGAATQNWLSQTDTINDNAYTLAQKALKNYTTNEQTLFGNRLNVANLEQVGKRHYAEKLNEQMLRLQSNNDRKEQYKMDMQKRKDELEKKSVEAQYLSAQGSTQPQGDNTIMVGDTPIQLAPLRPTEVMKTVGKGKNKKKVATMYNPREFTSLTNYFSPSINQSISAPDTVSFYQSLFQ